MRVERRPVARIVHLEIDARNPAVGEPAGNQVAGAAVLVGVQGRVRVVAEADDDGVAGVDVALVREGAAEGLAGRRDVGQRGVPAVAAKGGDGDAVGQVVGVEAVAVVDADFGAVVGRHADRDAVLRPGEGGASG